MIWGEKNKYCPSNFFPTPQGRDGWWFSRELSNASGGEQSTASRSPSHTKLWNETEVALWVRNPPANAGDAGSILGSGHPLEEEVTTHSSILAWKIPCMKKPGRLQSTGSQSQTQLSNSTFCSLWGLSTLLCAVVNCFFSFHYGNGPQSIVSSVVRKLLWMAVLWTFRVCLLVNVCTYFFQAFVSQWISGVLGIHIFIFRICEWTSESLLTICRILDVSMQILEVPSLVWNFRKCLKTFKNT